MDISDLRIFAAVARLGGMSRAAGDLNTVQSNVTARIRALEDELGAPLFHRHSRGVALTSAGERLLPFAEQAAHLLANAKRAVLDDGEPVGELRLGSLETTAGLRLPRVLSDYAAACPGVDLTLTTGTTCELIERVLARQLEGAFVCGPVDHPDLSEEVIFREELVLISSRGIRHLDDLVRQSELKLIVLRQGCSYRQRLEELLARRGVVGLRKLEFGSLDAIIGCVAAGIGISMLPRAVVAAAAREGRLMVHPVAQDDGEVATVFIRRRDGYQSSAMTAFLEQVRPPTLKAAASA